MQILASPLKEQGQEFVIVAVESSVGSGGDFARRKTATAVASLFPGVPIILMWQDARGTPTYWGRPDIARFLANTEMSRIPWMRYTVAA